MGAGAGGGGQGGGGSLLSPNFLGGAVLLDMAINQRAGNVVSVCQIGLELPTGEDCLPIPGRVCPCACSSHVKGVFPHDADRVSYMVYTLLGNNELLSIA